MQNTTTATAPKRGFSLRLFTYRKSIEKALTIKPQVVYHSLRASDVQRSDGRTFARVTFALGNDGAIWACCDCPAAHRALPCYHVAAAALARDIIAVPAGVEIAVEDKLVDSLTFDAITREEEHRANRFLPTPAEQCDVRDFIAPDIHDHCCGYCDRAWRCDDDFCRDRGETRTCKKCAHRDAPVVRPSVPRGFVRFVREGWDL